MFVLPPTQTVHRRKRDRRRRSSRRSSWATAAITQSDKRSSCFVPLADDQPVPHLIDSGISFSAFPSPLTERHWIPSPLLLLLPLAPPLTYW